MHLEERAVIAPSAQLMLVALLVTLARSEVAGRAHECFGHCERRCASQASRAALIGRDPSSRREGRPQARRELRGRPARLEPAGRHAQALGAGAPRVLHAARGPARTPARALHPFARTDRRRAPNAWPRTGPRPPETATGPRARGSRRRLGAPREHDRGPACPLSRTPSCVPAPFHRGARCRATRGRPERPNAQPPGENRQAATPVSAPRAPEDALGAVESLPSCTVVLPGDP